MPSGIRITLFGGIIPRLSDRGLPDNAAQFALNAKLYSGELRAWNNLRPLAQLPISGAKTVYHYVYDGVDKYLAFDVLTHVVKAPLVNETLGRLYWTNEKVRPQVNTAERIASGLPSMNIGVPSPEGSLTGSVTGGTADTAETRAYVVTFGTLFGEESAPSRPLSLSGNVDGTWVINGINSLSYEAAEYTNVTTAYLYRTISSYSGADYRRVAEWPIGERPASYIDKVTPFEASSAFALQALSWGPPPPGLQGLVSVAGGFLAGFVGRTVYLSVPYQPHSWPEDYQFAVEDNIVALATFGNTIVVLTDGRPALLVGPTPDAMSMRNMEAVQPCLSPRSVVNTVAGVMYSSYDGLVLIDGSSNTGQIVSRNWVTKDEWMSQFGPKTQMSSVYQDRYLSFYTSQLGFTVGFDDPVSGFTELQLGGVSSVDTDRLTSKTLITIGSTVYEWDGDPTKQMQYYWKSKPFIELKPVNFGAIQVRGAFSNPASKAVVIPAQGVGGFAINSYGVNQGKAGVMYGGSLNGPPAWQALGISPPAIPGPSVQVKLYVDDVLRWDGLVDSEAPYRLPSGFKGVKFEVELKGLPPIFSVALANTAKALEVLK